MFKTSCLFLYLLLPLMALSQPFISTQKKSGYLPLAGAAVTTSIYVDTADYFVVKKAAEWLQQDLEKVTGRKPELIHSIQQVNGPLIAIGSARQSALTQQLQGAGIRLPANTLQQAWEAYRLQCVEKNGYPVLTISGSDRRGTAYGVMELCSSIGVSPWYWWADVPVQQQQALYIRANLQLTDSPGVKYRGIFINDEAPAFSGWAREKFGGFNHQCYEKVFELLLRLKANYLWPAMWGNAFNDDDKLNPVLADAYGIVMGTSHHEPMLRAQTEWKRYGKGEWNYTSNDSVLRHFWRQGIQNMGTHESIVTIGMRGDGDMPMTTGTATALLERIVADQRRIIEEVTRKPAAETPQLWALYKEVQDYYDKGMRVPDDVTLLLCDDNWGNIRKLPKLTDKHRTGGYGIYYHFDYVGDPRNYKWLNTNQIERTWEQMHLAYAYGVNNIWIVNVGDLKPMEFPISFFLDYAWRPQQWNEDNLPQFYTRWAAQQFGEKHAAAIGRIIQQYTQYNARRKPELLSPDTYSLENYGEAEKVAGSYNLLLQQAENTGRLLPARYRDAYFQLVLHPVKACANLNQLYVAAAKNRYYAQRNDARANLYADSVKYLFARDQAISNYYNDTLAGGKWHHMMDQTHIGYTYWQQPEKNSMPQVTYVPAGSSVQPAVQTTAGNTARPSPAVQRQLNSGVFLEADGYVSMEAAHYSRAIGGSNIRWKEIPHLGRTLSAVTSFPVTVAMPGWSRSNPRLEYDFYSSDTGTITVSAYCSPTLNFHNNEGLQFALSVDDGEPVVLTLNNSRDTRVWGKWVADNINIQSARLAVRQPGKHVLRYWMISPAVVLQKLVLDFGGVKPAYLGPPESARTRH
jgi:hypothetical protein